jgi:hypothetical protein
LAGNADRAEGYPAFLGGEKLGLWYTVDWNTPAFFFFTHPEIISHDDLMQYPSARIIPLSRDANTTQLAPLSSI